MEHLIIISIVITAVFLIVSGLIKGITGITANAVLIIGWFFLNKNEGWFTHKQFSITLVCSVIPYLLIYLVFLRKKQIKEEQEGGAPIASAKTQKRKNASFNEYKRIPLKSGLEIKDVFAGVYVGGAAGSGKTRAIIVKILTKHFAKYSFAGIIYAYKNYELCRYLVSQFGRENCDIFAPNAPNVTVKINPLNPAYFNDETEIKSFFQEMLQNVTRGKKNDATSDFFNNAAVGLATGLTWIIKNRAPQYCTLPHIAALCLMNSRDNLCALLRSDVRAEMQASNYLNATGDALGSLNGTIANFFGAFSTPAIFYSLYDKNGKYVDLKVNYPENPRQLFLVNDIANEKVILPVINSVLYLSLSLLAKGDKYRSYTLIDEGSTINLEGFSRKPATLRSLENATVFAIQDLVLAVEQSNENTPRAIIANLSTQYFGKVNDPKTAKMYENIVETIEEKKRSYTSSSGKTDSSSTTVSKQNRKKFRADEFFRLKAGEFVTFTDGKSKKVFYDYKSGIDEAKITPVRDVSQWELNKNYEEILEWGKTYILL